MSAALASFSGVTLGAVSVSRRHLESALLSRICTRPPCTKSRLSPCGLPCSLVKPGHLWSKSERERKHGFSAEQVPVSAYVGISKKLKDLKIVHRSGALVPVTWRMEISPPARLVAASRKPCCGRGGGHDSGRGESWDVETPPIQTGARLTDLDCLVRALSRDAGRGSSLP